MGTEEALGERDGVKESAEFIITGLVTAEAIRGLDKFSVVEVELMADSEMDVMDILLLRRAAFSSSSSCLILFSADLFALSNF